MWNSSEEYVRRGKIPPGGTSPLPENPTEAAVESAVVPADPVNQKMPLARIVSRAVPITSLDDDDEVFAKPQVHESHQGKGDESDPFVLAILKSHMEAQEIFDKARLEREQVAFMAAILQSHELSEQVFQQLRFEKEAEQLQVQKNMVALAQEAARLHENLEQIFAKIGKEEEQPDAIIVPSSPRPAGPLGALMEELKTKTSVIDPTEVNEDDVSGEVETDASPSIPVPEIIATSLEVDSAAPSGTPRKTSDSSNLMLDELKKAFNEALSVKSTEGSEDEVSAEDVNISPSAIAQRRESPGLVAQNDSGAAEAH
jgi:hypothetical protein